jgi:hypothetical protein
MRAGNAKCMRKDYSSHTDHQPAIRRALKGIASAVAECNEAQRRLFELRMDPERYAFARFAVPDTYADFLLRTSGPLRHEPSARERGTR